MLDLIEDIFEGDNDYRYIIGRSPIFFLGVNPSTAKPGTPDPTIRFVESNFDSWIMLNIYPQIASKPQNLVPESKFDQRIHEKNIESIISIIDKYSNKTIRIVAAWGDSIEERRYLFSCLYKIVIEIKNKIKQIEWYRIGELTKKGNPRHPSYYLKTGETNIKDKLIKFDIDEYFNILTRLRKFVVSHQKCGTQNNH